MIIRNVNIVTMNPKRDIVFGDIMVEGNRIVKIGKINEKNTHEIDGSGLTVLPGFIQTHVHLCQVLFRNLADDLNLMDWLQRNIWPFEAAHSPSSIKISARLGIAELIKGGTTSILDMGTVHHTDYIFEEIVDTNYRAISGKVMMDFDVGTPEKLIEETGRSIKESEALFGRWHNKGNGRVKYAFCPRFAVTCSDELLETVKDIALEKKTLVHTHASENRKEVEIVKMRTGMTNITYLDSIGLLNHNLCTAHCIWVTEDEIQLLAKSNTKVLHCPSANLKLGSGIAPIPEMLEKGISVSIGGDGTPCNNNLDMFWEMRLAALIQKPRLGAEVMPAEKVFEMATLGAASALGLGDEIGSIEIGKKADIILLDLNRIHNSPMDNIYSQIVYSAKSEDVYTVIIDGNIVMKDRELLTIDEKKLMSDADREIKLLLDRA